MRRDLAANLGRSNRALRPLALAALAALACDKRDPPADMRLELPSVIDSRDPVVVTVHATNAQGVTSTISDGAELSVEPKDLATVSQPALVKCEHSGDGKLSVSVAGVSRSIALRCRIVDRIEATNAGRVELTAGPFKPKVRVLDKSGAELADVDVSFVSKNAGVAYPKDGMLVPKTVGTANLTARAGQATTDFKVDVVRKVVVEALPIDGNKRIYFSLDAGKYELTVKLPSPKRVNVEWRGAPYCNGSSDGLEHVSTCGLHATGGGGVVFDNPGYLLDGSKTISLDGVELYEVP
ncbi:MAG TPA: hypothetical protein VNW92_15850 [Polyangiaceae bacterium]|jgi:hypothetical protein|nr:hypothetical protein [Polyangiaceae bacterium]